MVVSSGQAYLITNKQAGTACDLSGQDQKTVIGFTPQKSDNQKWRVQDTGNGWTLQNVYNQKYLDLEGPIENGTHVVAVETGNPRTWDICPDQQDSNAYRIFVHGSQQNVDLDQGNPAQGTPVIIWGKWEGQNQVWRFEQV